MAGGANADGGNGGGGEERRKRREEESSWRWRSLTQQRGLDFTDKLFSYIEMRKGSGRLEHWVISHDIVIRDN